MKRNAFTLVEILVVVGSMMLIITAVSGIMFGVFSSKSKNAAISKMTQNGNWVLDELKKNILNASSETENGIRFDCPVGAIGSSMAITNVKDGDKTVISCFYDSDTDSYKIASVSAKSTVYLFQKNNDLVLKNCTNFVTCSTLPSLQLSEVQFNFDLGSAVLGLSGGTTKSFSIDVTLRN